MTIETMLWFIGIFSITSYLADEVDKNLLSSAWAAGSRARELVRDYQPVYWLLALESLWWAFPDPLERDWNRFTSFGAYAVTWWFSMRGRDIMRAIGDKYGVERGGVPGDTDPPVPKPPRVPKEATDEK